MHRRNVIERSIRAWKNNFVSGLSGTDKLFPVHLWYRLLDQAHITLNMLRSLRLNPKVSVNTTTEGNFDFNGTPLVELGTNIELKKTIYISYGNQARHAWEIILPKKNALPPHINAANIPPYRG